jgi:hypothetical protein
MSTPAQAYRLGTMRTVLITYGIAAYTFLLARHGPADASKAFGVGASAMTLVVSGIGLQVLLVVVRIAIKRVTGDREIAAQALGILDLIADSITVLLFALATYGVVAHAPEDL